VKTTETRFQAESYHGDLSPMLGGVVPSNFRVRLPNGGGDIQLISTLFVQQLGRTTLTLGKITTVDAREYSFNYGSGHARFFNLRWRRPEWHPDRGAREAPA
jgi:hypothetical protein